MHANDALPFAELLHPSLLCLLRTFDRGEFGQDFGPDVRIDSPDGIGLGRAVALQFDHGHEFLRGTRRELQDRPARGGFMAYDFRLVALEQAGRGNRRLQARQIELAGGGPVEHGQEELVALGWSRRPMARHVATARRPFA